MPRPQQPTNNDTPGEPSGADAAPVSARVGELIERGLEKYGAGDLDGALGDWEHALALEPESTRAQEYLDYVRDNFAELESQFAAARVAKDDSLSAGVPMPEIPEDVSGAYDMVEMEGGLSSPELDLAAPLPPPPGDQDDDVPISDGGDDDDEPLDLAEREAIPRGDSPSRDSRYDDDDESEILVLDAEEPPQGGPPAIEEDEDEVTMPGGEEPPPLPEQPAFASEAIAALANRVQPVIIRPRQVGEGTSPGTVPGFLPNALPAPPTVATPGELLLDDLGALDERHGAGDDDELDIDISSDGSDGEDERTGEVSIDDRSDDAATPAARRPRKTGESGIGEPLDVASLGLAGDDTGEATFAAGNRRSISLLGDEPLTLERHAERLVGNTPIDLDDRSVDRSERSPFGKDQVAGAAEVAAAGARGARSSNTGPAVIVDDSLLRGVQDAEEDEPTHMRARLPSGILDVGTADDSEDAIRRRVSELLTMARQACERGDFTSAVVAAEAAAAQDPDGKVGPVIMHRHRDLLYRVYEAHIGEMAQVPLLAVPLHQIAAETMDHRAGFLLSRIDGMLSFEDILDVSGMPRLDAYRILSNLLRKGFIEVR